MKAWLATVVSICTLMTLPMPPAGAAGSACDRGCLKTLLDQYLNAVVKHDPSAAPLFVGFRQTQNAVVERLGAGAWTSITALGKVQRRYLDPVNGQAAYYGTLEEGSATVVATVRVKIDDRKISEAEWIVARKEDWGPNGPGGALVNPDSLAANAPPERVVPKDARASREAMVAIANSYFDGLTTHDGSIIMHEPGCVRIENGTVMSGPNGRGPNAGRGGDCSSNLANLNVSLVAGRRFPIVDEEAGVVLGIAVFMRKPGTATRRNYFSEWFFVDNHKIRTIYTAMFYPPHDQPVPNWPPYEGHWPLPPSFAPPAQ
jgi:hypothetical protein